MGAYKTKLVKQNIKLLAANSKKTVRKHVNADAMIKLAKKDFEKIPDHRSKNASISLEDTLMSRLAMFLLKDPSLLVFDERRYSAPHNLMTIYGMGSIPCDTSMREILDGVDPNDLRPLFKDAFRQLQRGKVLEKFVFMEGCYLLNLDGLCKALHKPSPLRR